MSTAAKLSIEEHDANLADLLDRSERGEEVTINRHGHPVARLMPTRAVQDAAQARRAVDEILKLRDELARSGVQPFTVEEILALRHAGHRH